MELLTPDAVVTLKWLFFALLLGAVAALGIPSAAANIDNAFSKFRRHTRNTEYEDESSH